MRRLLATTRCSDAAVRRLTSLADLDPVAEAAIEKAAARAIFVPRGHDIVVEGKPIGPPQLLIDGWAVRVRLLPDGRRQFLEFLLPGDLIGLCRHARPLAVATLTALTGVVLAPAPPADTSPSLAAAYAMSAAIGEVYLLDHISRLGRLTAIERIVSLMVEFDERLTRCGLSAQGDFEMPLTQEQLADALGLTAVHTNRMLQVARRDGLLSWAGGRITLSPKAAMAAGIPSAPVRVSGPI